MKQENSNLSSRPVIQTLAALAAGSPAAGGCHAADEGTGPRGDKLDLRVREHRDSVAVAVSPGIVVSLLVASKRVAALHPRATSPPH